MSNNPINVVNIAGNFLQVGTLNNVLVSTIRMNNGFAPTDPTVVYGFPIAANSGLNSLPNTGIPIPNGSGNLQAFRVTPSLGGTFTLNGIALTWYNSGANAPNNPPGSPALPFNENLFYILNTLIAGAVYPGTTITPVFNTTSQTLTLFSSNAPRPIQIIDNTGNFTVFTGLNGNTSIGSLSSGLLTRVSSAVSSQKIIEDQSAAVLNQLNASQANLAAVSYSASDPGVPFETEQENAVKSLIAFNASLQVMQVLNQMYADLVSIVGGAPSNNFLNGRQ